MMNTENESNKQELLDLYLFAAIRLNRLDLVEKLIAAGANIHITVDVEEDTNWTPLHIACRLGHISIVNVLLTAGADKEAKTGDELTPLHVACRTGYIDVVKVLITAGADKAAVTNYGWVPLHFTACGDADEKYKILSSKCKIEEYQLLVKMVETVDMDWTPLHIGVMLGSKDLIELLVAAGANLEALFVKPFSIRRMVKQIFTETYDNYFIEGKIENISKLKDLVNDFLISSQHQKQVNWSQLPAMASRSDKRSSDNPSLGFPMSVYEKLGLCLLLSEMQGQLDLLDGLLTNVRSTDDVPAVTFGQSSLVDYLGIVNFLLAKGIDIELEDRSNNITALQIACASSQVDLVKALLNAGALPKIDSQGRTLLHKFIPFHSTKWAASEMVDTLLRAGVNMYQKDKEGETSFDHGNFSSDYNSMLALLEAGYQIPELSKIHLPFICRSVARQSSDVTKQLLKQLLQMGVDVNAKKFSLEADMTALHAFFHMTKTILKYDRAHKLDFDYVHILLEAGADIYAKNAGGLTPLQLACSCSVDILNQLLQYLYDKMGQENKREEFYAVVTFLQNEANASYAEDVLDLLNSIQPPAKHALVIPKAQSAAGQIGALGSIGRAPKANEKEMVEATSSACPKL